MEALNATTNQFNLINICKHYVQKKYRLHIVTKQQDNVAQGRLRLKSTLDKRMEGVSACMDVTFYQP